MKAYVILRDVNLYSALERYEGFSVVASLTTGMESVLLENEDKVLIISDQALEAADLPAIREVNPGLKIIYLLSNQDDSFEIRRVQGVCAAHNIQYITPYHTLEQLAQEIIHMCFNTTRKLSHIITGISPLPQMGLTSAMLSVANVISKMYNIRIGFFGMNGWNPGDTFFKYDGKYFDEIWGALNGRTLYISDLKPKMHEIRHNFHYLAGNRDMKKLYYYQTEGVAHMLKEARSEEGFDLIFCDAGAYFDHALAAQSMYAADLILINMNQQKDSMNAWARSLEQLLKPILKFNKDKSALMFNKMYPQKTHEVFSPSKLSEQMGKIPFFGSLPYLPNFFLTQANKGLFAVDDPEYNEQLVVIAKAIGGMYGFPLSKEYSDALEAEKQVKKSFWRRGTSNG